jgi:hypothetical protein
VLPNRLVAVRRIIPAADVPVSTGAGEAVFPRGETERWDQACRRRGRRASESVAEQSSLRGHDPFEPTKIPEGPKYLVSPAGAL